MQEQLQRTPRPFPKLIIKEYVKFLDFKDINVKDFDIIGYFPYPSIKAPMAV
jgi:thymidylate synthase